MCYHYSLTTHALRSTNRYSAMQDDYSVIEEYDDMYHVNGFTFPKVPVIASDSPTKIQLFQWGLVPSWVKDEESAKKIRMNTLNARSETIYEKPSYRSAAKAGRRCIIPVDGIYEWQAVNKKKYPHYITFKNKEIFSIAGIWEEWVNRDSGEILKSFSMVTTDANPLMARIHNDGQRMPLILPKELEMDWLNENLTKDDVMAMAVPFPDTEMQGHTIDKVFSQRGAFTNYAEIQNQVVYPELQVQTTLF
ncbi:MAG: SOS response-associated peptidase [Pedobacter sp.]|nr:MAG: SOS response-associated peptidase [Pedobacter sp.]